MLKKEYDALKKAAKNAVSAKPISPRDHNPIVEICGLLTFITVLLVLFV
jgi:hypothetical protein